MKQQPDALNSDKLISAEIVLLAAEQEMDELKNAAQHWEEKYQQALAVARQYWQRCDCGTWPCDVCEEYSKL